MHYDKQLQVYTSFQSVVLNFSAWLAIADRISDRISDEETALVNVAGGAGRSFGDSFAQEFELCG